MQDTRASDTCQAVFQKIFDNIFSLRAPVKNGSPVENFKRVEDVKKAEKQAEFRPSRPQKVTLEGAACG